MKIDLRKAQFYDIPFLWYVRNQKDVYQYFKTPAPVSWEKHIEWIIPILLSLSQKELYVITREKSPAGQLRFDYDGESAEISISLLKELRGKGIASNVLKKAIAKVRREKIVNRLLAEIHIQNSASIGLFTKFGFKKIYTREKFVTYSLSL